MSLTVGILAYNSEHTLPDLLESLPAGLAGVPEWRLVIADGASEDGTLAVAKERVPEAVLVPLGANLGFAAAANAVIDAEPDSDAVLILSPTVRLTPGCVAPMLEALRGPGVGIAVPRLFRGTGRPFPSLRRRPTLARAFAEALLGGRLASRVGTLGELVAGPERYTSSTKADWATGAVTLVSRACLTAVGRWDESYFLYSEETDFELRAGDAGFRLAFTDVDVTHLGGVSRARPELFALSRANRVRLYAKRHHRPAADLYWAATLLGELLRCVGGQSAIHRAAAAKLLRERPALTTARPDLT